MKFSFIAMLTSNFLKVLCLQYGDEHVCSDLSARRLFCCYNYEEIDGKCEECDKGTTSRNGTRCLPCRSKTYGWKCLQTCNCIKTAQRCDSLLGCVNLTMKPENSSESANSGGLMNEPVIYYGSAGLGFIGLTIGICVLIIKRRVINIARNHVVTQQQDVIEIQEAGVDTDNYDEIDESLLEENIVKQMGRNSYLSVINSSDEGQSSSSLSDSDGYLKPSEIASVKKEDSSHSK